MSFINFFSKKKSYKKYGDILKNKMSSKEQRLEAIDVLEKLDAAEGITELLKRFEIVLESGLQDVKEKESCLNAIVKHGSHARPYVEHYLENQKRLAWVIRIAEKIFPKDEFLQLILKNVHTDVVEFDDDTMERNLDILFALKEFQDPNITEKISPFLSSRDDDTRIAVLECLEVQAEIDPKARNIILNLAQNPTNDINSRFMGAVTHIIKKNRW